MRFTLIMQPSLVNKINKWFRELFLKIYESKYDVFWFTAPLLESTFLIQRVHREKIVIYDCMDDMLSFPASEEERQISAENERVLYERADIVFSSSQYLRGVLERRYPEVGKSIIVVNNALSLPKTTRDNKELPHSIKSYIDDKRKKIAYIGTVSEWIDFDLCDAIATRFPDAVVYFWGPYKSKTTERIHSDRIVLCGAAEHKYVYSIMEGADILIMPFLLNDLVLSVNPVKLYEYVLSGRPSLAPLYGESLPFEEYVYLYNNHEECLNIINRILEGVYGAKQSKEKCLEFAQVNTWAERGRMIREVLKREVN